MTTQFTIQPFDYSDAHYDVFVAIHNRLFPNFATTIEIQKRWVRLRPPDRFQHHALVHDAESDQFVAYGEIRHHVDTFHPQKFHIDIQVMPEFEGRGAGTLMYGHLLDAVASFNPTKLEVETDSSKPRSSRLIEQNGYKLMTREYTSKLDLGTFDPTLFSRHKGIALRHGIEIVTLDQLIARFPDTYERGLYDMMNEIDKDIPWHDEIKPQSFEQWLKGFHDAPHRVSDGYLTALDGDEMVGITMLFQIPGLTDMLHTGLTGVKRSHRRKGIAMALKLRALTWAQTTLRASDGTLPSVMTENEENNPMYAINERLGIERQPDWLSYVKELVPAEAAQE